MSDPTYEKLVKDLQTYLNGKVTNLQPLEVDGDLGKLTWTRAQTYQAKLKAPAVLGYARTAPIPPVPTKAVRPNLTDWRLARTLSQLRSQINNQWPQRSKESDGTIGDAKHATRNSDHNPWVHDSNGQPVVTALDITHDPANGVDCNALIAALFDDPRIKYIIWNGRIYNAAISLKWRKYDGTNPHTKHVHISVKSDQKFYDDEKPWEIV